MINFFWNQFLTRLFKNIILKTITHRQNVFEAILVSMYVYLSLWLSTVGSVVHQCIKCLCGLHQFNCEVGSVHDSYALSVVKHRIGIVGCLPKMISTPFVYKKEGKYLMYHYWVHDALFYQILSHHTHFLMLEHSSWLC